MTNFTDQKAKPAVSRLSFFDNLNEARVSEWLETYGKNIGYLLLSFLVLLTLGYLISKGFTTSSEKDYLQAANDFAVITKHAESKDSPEYQEAFKNLNTMMNKQKELHAVYDGALAQILLNRGEISDAKIYADATLVRTQQNHLEFYTNYAKTSLLISEKKFQEALDQAKLLQTKMFEMLNTTTEKETLKTGSELFALNLLRIAVLQQKLGDKTGEYESLQQWLQYAGLKNGNAPLVKNLNTEAFKVLIQQLAIGTISLPDYIANREILLKKPN